MNQASLIQKYYLQRFCWPRLRRVCIAAMVWDPPRPDDVSSWDFARFTQGTVDHLKGYDILAMLKEYDVLVLQHWPPAVVVDLIRARCPKLTVLLWVAIEATHAENVWSAANPLQENLRQELSVYWQEGTDGKPINLYYGQNKAPAYAVNVWDLDLALVTQLLFEARVSIGAHGFFTDSMIKATFYGTAPNAIPRYDRRLFWADYSRELRDYDPEALLWGNTVGPASKGYFGLDVCFAEQYFYSRGMSIDLASSSLHEGLCLNTQLSNWVARDGDWKYLAHSMALQGLHDVYVCTARTGEQYLPGIEWYW